MTQRKGTGGARMSGHNTTLQSSATTKHKGRQPGSQKKTTAGKNQWRNCHWNSHCNQILQRRGIPPAVFPEARAWRMPHLAIWLPVNKYFPVAVFQNPAANLRVVKVNFRLVVNNDILPYL